MKNVTVEEALKLMCPFMWIAGCLANIVEPHMRCMADNCMMWEWDYEGWTYASGSTSDDKKLTRVGHCGLIHRK